MRSSDWSSDVCSTDLSDGVGRQLVEHARQALRPGCRCGCGHAAHLGGARPLRSEEHTSELQSLMRISYAVFCLKKKKNSAKTNNDTDDTKPHNTHMHKQTQIMTHNISTNRATKYN